MRVTIAVCVLWASIVAGSANAAGPFTFRKIADADLDDLEVRAVAINNNGVVAFNRRDPNGVQTLFTGRGGALTKIADTAGPIAALLSWDINRHGVVGFSALLDEASSIPGQLATGVFTGSGSGLRTVLRSNDAVTLVGGGAINDFGQVALSAMLSTGESVIATRWPDRIIARTTEDELSVGDINNHGVVVFQTFFGSEDLLVGSGGPVTTLVSGDNSPVLFLQSPARINDAGTVAFKARMDNDAVAILTADEDGFRIVVDSTSIGFGLGPPTINNLGQLAAGINKFEYQALYTGTTTPRLVIEVGDMLDGSQVTRLSTGDEGRFLNDAGQIAFWARLADGRAGIYRADPAALGVAIPEPSNWRLISLSAVGMILTSAAYRRRCDRAGAPVESVGRIF